MRFVLVILFSLIAGSAAAQSYPEYNSTTVNDYAGVLDAEAEGRIGAALTSLRDETDIEMTVLTLSRQDIFAPDQTLEEFATGLFNTWGIGDKTRNDGILVMVLITDRAMRIELGSGYGTDWNRAAARVIDDTFLPAFKDGDYQNGIETGVGEVIRTIARPFHEGQEAPSSGGISKFFLVLLALPLLIPIALKKLRSGLARCPSCNQRGMDFRDEVIEAATRTSEGMGRSHRTCRHCGYDAVSDYTISRKSDSSSSSSGSFGGGSSSGGGSSGRW